MTVEIINMNPMCPVIKEASAETCIHVQWDPLDQSTDEEEG